MHITVNGKAATLPDGAALWDARAAFSPRASVLILNGFQTNENLPLGEGDAVTLIEKGVMPDEETLEAMMAARHSPHVHDTVKKACVGIAGLGGLGSAIALMLARTGVGHLVLADFDMVEPSNLNRQNYRIRDLGQPKTAALAAQIADINPYISVETHHTRVTEQNAAPLFRSCSVVCEAFDDPAAKAMLFYALCEQMPAIRVVSASGMAGYGSSNTIVTKRRMDRLYVCGDGETAAENGIGLMAPRVTICAAHQANMALRLLLGITTP